MELAKSANNPLGTRILVTVIALSAMAGRAAAEAPPDLPHPKRSANGGAQRQRGAG